MNGPQRDAILQQAASLPSEIQPQRDLWPQIEAQIGARRAPSRRRPWLLALAAALALVAVTAGVTWQLAQSQLAVPATGVMAELAAGGTVNRAAAEVQYMRTQLTQSLEANLSRLPPDSRKVIVENLLEIRASLVAIEQALASNPGNPSLQQLLYTTYERELAVLADANRIALSLPEEVEI